MSLVLHPQVHGVTSFHAIACALAGSHVRHAATAAFRTQRAEQPSTAYVACTPHLTSPHESLIRRSASEERDLLADREGTCHVRLCCFWRSPLVWWPPSLTAALARVLSGPALTRCVAFSLLLRHLRLAWSPCFVFRTGLRAVTWLRRHVHWRKRLCGRLLVSHPIQDTATASLGPFSSPSLHAPRPPAQDRKPLLPQHAQKWRLF